MSVHDIAQALSDEPATVPASPFVIAEKPTMSITGTLTLKAKFEAARARKVALEARADSAVNTYNSAADIAEGAIKSLEDDAAALQAEAAAFSNGAPT